MIKSDSKLWARALAVTTMTAAAVLLAGCSLLGDVTDIATGGNDDNPAEGTEDGAFSIVVGDCFNEDSGGETISTVDIVECDVEHLYEAYASIKMTDAEFPGDEAAQTQANEVCNEPFTEYVGVDYDTSAFDYTFYLPTQESWDDPVLQDREILCLIVSDDETATTGSVKGTNA